MSVQLEIFPQNYLGYVTAFTPPPLELITDGQVFGANLPPAQDPIIAKRLMEQQNKEMTKETKEEK